RSSQKSIRGDRWLLDQDGHRGHGDVHRSSRSWLEISLSWRDPRLWTRAVVGVRLPRATPALGSGFDAESAQSQSSDLSGSDSAAAIGVPVVDRYVSGRNPEADLLSGAGSVFPDRVAARERDERSAGNASRAVCASQHHFIRAIVARNGMDTHLRALQHGEILDVHKNVQRLFHPEAAQIQRDA